MPNNLVLLGFMGVGKTTLGRLAAVMLGTDFIDLDEKIEEDTGLSIPTIFETYGEQWFRDFEHATLESLQNLSGCVIAVGGGAPCQPENVELIRSLGLRVLLTAEPESILERVQPIESRPLLAQAADPSKRIETLMQQRMPWYRQADRELRTDGITPEEGASRLVEMYMEWMTQGG